jgi:hypothetical protein
MEPIQSQLCRIRNDRVDLDKERQLLLEDQCKLRSLIAFQTPATATGPGDLESLRIQVRLQVLERKRTRLANQEADLRRQERSLQLGSRSSASSSRSDSPPTRTAFPEQEYSSVG